MARFNPYGNSQIADSISGIAKALIGSADTDAALARARASDALLDIETRKPIIKINYLIILVQIHKLLLMFWRITIK